VLLARQPVVDNRPLEARDDVLVFTGEPLAADLDAVGPVEAEVWMRSTREDTDLFVRICDVDPGGASWNVTDALIRLRPGEPPRDDDGVARVRFELWPIAHRFRAGQRIRVQVSSGAHPRYARNPGTGEDALAATRLLSADQEVFHDAARPSAVMLSVVGPDVGRVPRG
jgi:putative CocE/NonD family hydrolase